MLRISPAVCSRSWSALIRAFFQTRRSRGISRMKRIRSNTQGGAAIQSTAMCGRHRLSRRAEILAAYDAEYEGVDWDARYNIAPTQNVPVIRQDAKDPIRRASLMRWGLIPSWANDATIGPRMINARSETAAEKPAFKECLERRRCLIPADAFYEWKRTGKSKQPYCFEMIGREPFAFAGLWDRWRAPDGTTLETCTILTTMPNQLLADVHDRMPVILPPSRSASITRIRSEFVSAISL